MADGVVSVVKLPSRIGRHAVVGYIADGGMSEIYLGRDVEAHPIVIKRILPHLARQQNFVSMFIDEARIGSQIKHPNVVEIHELGQVGTDLFMVMEYLAGETVSGLLRRMELRQSRLDIALAAFVIAEACAGLQAAHDLCDHTGKPLGVIHRDISPSNLFVTYSGEVKVLDFGIATAVDRISRTATGHVKGKFSYMSPEQCMGIPLDSRSDLWSLGVVLYELSTQRRLFKLPNELLVLKAVTQDPIPRPRKELPQYPQFMEQIVMKALQREPTRRYSTAHDLREDLLDAMSKLGFSGDPRAALARVMEELFPERIAEKRAMLYELHAGTQRFETLPPAEVDQNVELAQMPEHSLTSPPPRKSRSWLVVAIAVLVVCAAGFATWKLAHRDFPAPPQTTESITMPVEKSTAPAPAAPPVVPPKPAPIENMTVTIETVPPGATIKINGRAFGTTPVEYELGPAGGEIDVSISKPGYVDIRQVLDIDHEQRLLIPLVKSQKSGAKSGAKKKGSKDPFERFD